MPNRVKGSKQHKMVVVPDRPWRRRLITATLLLAVVAAGGLGYALGHSTLLQAPGMSRSTQATLQTELERLELENSELTRQLAIVDRGISMDRLAGEQVQLGLADLRARVTELEQENAYYRKVIAEQAGDTGLTVSQFDLRATRQQERFQYKLVMRQQDADGDSWLSGTVQIRLVGMQAGVARTYALHELSEQVEELDIRLRFRYFQNIEGDLTLPADFVPQRVEINAVSVEPVAKTIQEQFAWVVEND